MITPLELGWLQKILDNRFVLHHKKSTINNNHDVLKLLNHVRPGQSLLYDFSFNYKKTLEYYTKSRFQIKKILEDMCPIYLWELIFEYLGWKHLDWYEYLTNHSPWEWCLSFLAVRQIDNNND